MIKEERFVFNLKEFYRCKWLKIAQSSKEKEFWCPKEKEEPFCFQESPICQNHREIREKFLLIISLKGILTVISKEHQVY